MVVPDYMTVNKDLLRVIEQKPGPESITEIPLNELEELLIGEPTPGIRRGKNISPGEKFTSVMRGPGKKVITANSDKANVNFGYGIDEKELEYLHQLIKNKITEQTRRL